MIRFFVRWMFRLFVLLIVLGVSLVLLKDTLAKAIIEAQIRTQTGWEVNIGNVQLGLFSPTLTIDQLRLYNSTEFGGAPFLNIPDLHLVYRPGALALRRLHFKLVRLSLTELWIVQGRNGQTNLILSLDQLEYETSSARDRVLGCDFDGIDLLNLSLGKIRYLSLRQPQNATEVELGLQHQMFTNISSVAELKNVVIRCLFRNGITIVTGASAAPALAEGSPHHSGRPGVKTVPKIPVRAP